MTRNPVTVTVAYHVIPGRETDFHSWGWAVLRASSREPGFLGGGVLADGEAEWHVVYRFDQRGVGPGLGRLDHPGTVGHPREPVRPGDGAPQRAGSKSWFDAQTGAPKPPAAPLPPAKWKLWFVNMSAVFPPVLLFNLLVIPYLGGLNPLIRTLLLCLCVTALVTWILMPRLQRFFKKWLYPPLQALRGRHKRRTA